MKLINFNIDNDSIALNYNGLYLDLHNNFDFRSFNYDVLSRQLELTWTRSHEDWAKEKIPAFKLIFRGVTFFKIRERDDSSLSSDDKCLSLIGFLPKDLRDDFDSFVDQKDVQDSDDLNILFENGQALKIKCTYVDFLELNEEIIYVQIVNEPMPVWRPMWAVRLEENIYKIKSFINFDPSDEFEELEFSTGEIVICEMQKRSVGQVSQVLVAIRKKNDDK